MNYIYQEKSRGVKHFNFLQKCIRKTRNLAFIKLLAIILLFYPGLVKADGTSLLINGSIFAENRAYSDFFTNAADYYEMRVWATSVNNTLPIFVQNLPHTSGAVQVKIPYMNILDLLHSPYFTYTRKFSAQNGFSVPGSDWEGRSFLIYMDENLNGMLDPGESSLTWTIPEGSIQQLNIPVVTITGQRYPTITWTAINGAEIYNVRLWALTEANELSDVLFSDYISADGSSSYSFKYEGDLFSQYSILALSVMASDINSGLVNRSTYITTHSAKVNLTGVILLMLD